MKTKQRRKSAEERSRIVEGYGRSGQTQREYAARAGIGMSTLGLWLRQSRGGRGARLVEAQIFPGDGQRVGGWMYRVSLPGGARLEVGSGFEIAEVRALVRILKEEG